MSLAALAKICYQNSLAKGFWDEGNDRNKSEMLCLMHSEISELLEALRDPDEPMSEKIEGYTQEEEELADLVIRALDYAGGWGLDLEGAVKAKIFYNSHRPMKHGKLF